MGLIMIGIKFDRESSFSISIILCDIMYIQIELLILFQVNRFL